MSKSTNFQIVLLISIQNPIMIICFRRMKISIVNRQKHLPLWNFLKINLMGFVKIKICKDWTSVNSRFSVIVVHQILPKFDFSLNLVIRFIGCWKKRVMAWWLVKMIMSFILCSKFQSFWKVFRSKWGELIIFRTHYTNPW